MKFAIGDHVWKSPLGEAGYEGPGKVVGVFKNWMGQPRYVVEHMVSGGRGCFYHIYAEAQLALRERDDP